MKTVMVNKEKISPAFGLYHYDAEIAEIRDDLPKQVENFVIEHERGHSKGKGEIMATLSAIPKHPLGFIVTVFMSLAPYRLKYYLKRIINRK